MTKVYELIEAYTAVSNTCELMKICKTTMNDAKRALEKEPDSQELKAIYDRAYMDYQFLASTYDEFKMYYEVLYGKYQRDPEFIAEVMNTSEVIEGYEEIFSAIKTDITQKYENEKS